MIIATHYSFTYAVVEFDNDDKTAKNFERKTMFCSLVIVIKNFSFIINRKPRRCCPISFHNFYSALYNSWPPLFYSMQECFLFCCITKDKCSQLDRIPVAATCMFLWFKLYIYILSIIPVG